VRWWILTSDINFVIFGRGWYNRPVRGGGTKRISLMPSLIIKGAPAVNEGTACRTRRPYCFRYGINVANQETRLYTQSNK
jgi:hypothetical protein